MVLVFGVTLDFGGTPIVAPGGALLAFMGFACLLALLAVYFNRSTNHESEYVDERWGYGSIDDSWDLTVADARLAVRARLREMAERADTHTDSLGI